MVMPTGKIAGLRHRQQHQPDKCPFIRSKRLSGKQGERYKDECKYGRDAPCRRKCLAGLTEYAC
jgi:hypothetical protein